MQNEPSIKINESSSVLEYVDIMFAGVDNVGEPVPAVRASPLPPRLTNVNIMYSALDATNFTDVKTSTYVTDSVLKGNRGMFYPKCTEIFLSTWTQLSVSDKEEHLLIYFSLEFEKTSDPLRFI